MDKANTPGPWYANKSGPESHQQATVASETTGATVAVVYDRKDAALIAAAPELLAALRVVLCWTGAIPPSESGINPPSERFATEVARAAIAKAEGRS